MRGAWSERPSRAARIVWGEQDPEDIDLDGNGSQAPDDATEREVALRIAEYWKAHPEKLVEALRWADTNQSS